MKVEKLIFYYSEISVGSIKSSIDRGANQRGYAIQMKRILKDD